MLNCTIGEDQQLQELSQGSNLGQLFGWNGPAAVMGHVVSAHLSWGLPRGCEWRAHHGWFACVGQAQQEQHRDSLSRSLGASGASPVARSSFMASKSPPWCAALPLCITLVAADIITGLHCLRSWCRVPALCRQTLTYPLHACGQVKHLLQAAD